MEGKSIKNHVVYICDSGYICPTIVSVKSALQNLKNEIAIHIIAVDLEKYVIEDLRRIDSNIDVIECSADDFKKKGQFEHLYVTMAALFKFNIPNLLPDVNKVLYIDGDTILQNGFDSVFDIDLEEKYAAVVSDMIQERDGKWNEKLYLEHYFNSGMMLLNLDKLRKDQISEKLLLYKIERPKETFMDQNAFNSVFNNNVLFLDWKFNYLAIYEEMYSLAEVMDYFSVVSGETDSLIKKASIVHYAGTEKVWNSPGSEAYTLWSQYVDGDVMKYLFRSFGKNCEKEFQNLNKRLENEVFQINTNKLDRQVFSDFRREILEEKERLEEEISLLREQLSVIKQENQSLKDEIGDIQRMYPMILGSKAP